MTEEDKSIIEEVGLQDSLRKAMSGRIPEFQQEIDDDTVYCEKCGYEVDYTPSVLSVHNLRRHEWHDDIYDMESRECSSDSCNGNLTGTIGHMGTEGLIRCEQCGELQ